MMRGTAKLLVAGVLLPTLVGCSWLGWGKNTDAVSDTQAPGNYDTGGSAYDANAYPPAANAYPSDTASSGPRYHTVSKQDTLYSLARQYYGDQAKWRDIYNANRTAIPDANKIRVGQRLVIP